MDAAVRAQPCAANRPRILIVEDDVPLSKFLGRELVDLGFSVDVRHDAEPACELLKSNSHDLVILDLSRGDGMTFLQRIRTLVPPQVPILVLSARTSSDDVVRALDCGADDCLSKPFSFRELQARMRCLLRRNTRPATASMSSSSATSSASRVDDLEMNREERRVVRGARRIDLTPREFAILDHLMTNAGKPVSRTDLMSEVWNIAFDPKTNIVDVYMKYVRDKVDGVGERKLIHTVRGVGYVLSDN